jgi:nuclear GTP-binding protein
MMRDTRHFLTHDVSNIYQLSRRVIGYPNVGKSSVINTLISKKSCKVAPIPGETKIWQYISLFKRISLIDCPGVVVDTAGDTETDSVLKGVVRAERLENPEDFVSAIQDAVKREHIAAQYGLPKEGDDTWKDSTELMEMIATKSGRLLKGGEPCLRSAAIMLINDFQRGRLPHYVAPPELKEDEAQEATRITNPDGVECVDQDLDAVGSEAMKGDHVDNAGAEQGEGAASKDGDQDQESKATCSEKEASDNLSSCEEERDSALATIGEGEWDDEN